jgi:hypothetical protein
MIAARAPSNEAVGSMEKRQAVAFALAACLGALVPSCYPSGAVLGEPLPVGPLPTELEPSSPAVGVEVASIGLGGYLASPEKPAVVRLALENRGPRRLVRVSLEEVTNDPAYVGLSTMRGRVDPLELVLAAGERRELSWTVPIFGDAAASIPPDKGGLFAVARDATGRLLGAARAPRTQTYGLPIAVLAGTEEVGLSIQNQILRAAPANERPQIAIVLGDPPARFWEYEPASAVVLARSYIGLSADQKTAIRRFAAFGGTVVVPEAYAVDAAALTALDAGAGRIPVLRAPQDGVGPSAQEQWRAIVTAARTQGGTPEATLPLEMHVVLPSTTSLIVLVGIIVLLVGPALHIALMRARRREWSWIGVPGLSILLAAAMYGLASRTEGVENGAEIQRLHVTIGTAADALVLTQVRVQTKAAAHKTVRLLAAPGADARHDGLQRFLYSGGISEAPAVRMDAEGVEIGPMALHRWSSQDVAFASAGAPIPLEVERDGEGVRISNTSRLALSEIDLRTDRGWTRVAASLAPGASLALKALPNPDPDPTAFPVDRGSADFAKAYARSGLLSTASTAPRPGGLGELRVLARCAPQRMPRVEVRPAAERVVEVTRCLWISPAPRVEGAVP